MYFVVGPVWDDLFGGGGGGTTLCQLLFACGSTPLSTMPLHPVHSLVMRILDEQTEVWRDVSFHLSVIW